MSTLRLPFAIFVVVLSGWVAASCGGRSDLDFDGRFATYDGGKGGSNSTPKCGDNVCAQNENFQNCPADCHVSSCGNGVCDNGESTGSCPFDCRCGNGVCDANEQVTCPGDCPPMVVCGNGRCEPGENPQNCSVDCGRCGNGMCEVNENRGNCPQDCTTTSCGNGVCEPQFGETAASCPNECKPYCGDRVCRGTSASRRGPVRRIAALRRHPPVATASASGTRLLTTASPTAVDAATRSVGRTRATSRVPRIVPPHLPVATVSATTARLRSPVRRTAAAASSPSAVRCRLPSVRRRAATASARASSAKVPSLAR